MSNVDGTQNELMAFRTLWLRTVAHAWTNPGFAGDLCNPEKRAADVIKGKFGGTRIPLEEHLELKVKQEKNVNDRILWAGDDWCWPTQEDETLTLSLPLTAPIQDAAKHAVVLADYYAIRPSIFGGSGQGGSSGRGVARGGFNLMTLNLDSTLQSALLDSAPTGVTFASSGPDPNGFVPTEASFFDFSVALSFVMAKCWENDAFRALVLNRKTVNKALGRARGFTPPWAMKIVITDDTNARWHDETVKGSTYVASGWDEESLSKHELLLNLPMAPQEPHDYSVALAAYNATGAEFPFTCCP